MLLICYWIQFVSISLRIFVSTSYPKPPHHPRLLKSLWFLDLMVSFSLYAVRTVGHSFLWQLLIIDSLVPEMLFPLGFWSSTPSRFFPLVSRWYSTFTGNSDHLFKCFISQESFGRSQWLPPHPANFNDCFYARNSQVSVFQIRPPLIYIWSHLLNDSSGMPSRELNSPQVSQVFLCLGLCLPVQENFRGISILRKEVQHSFHFLWILNPSYVGFQIFMLERIP